MTPCPGAGVDEPGGRSVDSVRLVEGLVRWAAARPDVRGVGLAGSRARGTAGPGSDVDLVVVVRDPDHYLGASWVAEALDPHTTDLLTCRWGVLLERRLLSSGGLEIEVGFVPESWAAVPVDPGTARVVADGFVVLHDPSDLLGRLVGEVAGTS